MLNTLILTVTVDFNGFNGRRIRENIINTNNMTLRTKHSGYAQLVIFGVLLVSCNSSQVLFEKDSNDWKSYGDGTWSFNNNELTGTASNSTFVMTDDRFDNFLLTLEFKPDSLINSGVFIRCSEKKMSSEDCYEINIWDTHPNQDSRTGSIVKKARPLAIVNTIGKWNTYKILAQSDHLKVWINNTLTIDMIDSSLSDGHIGFQAAGKGEIKFRNIKVKPLR